MLVAQLSRTPHPLKCSILGKNLSLYLEECIDDSNVDELKFRELVRATTNNDGRVAPGTLPKVKPGIYRMTFLTRDYYKQSGKQCFYPLVRIVFEVAAGEHYHVPLLVSPFGYRLVFFFKKYVSSKYDNCNLLYFSVLIEEVERGIFPNKKNKN
jgi:5-hydroxyisourate hydrolase-like protein (transthyretin family)